MYLVKVLMRIGKETKYKESKIQFPLGRSTELGNNGATKPSRMSTTDLRMSSQLVCPCSLFTKPCSLYKAARQRNKEVEQALPFGLVRSGDE